MITEAAVRILGPLEVEVSGRAVSLPSPSQRTLLLRLVVDAGRPVSIESLVDALWDGSPPTDPMSALRFHVSKLRKALTDGDLIETTGTGYLLAIDPESVDAHRFDHLVTSATATSDPRRTLDLTEEALDLWRGEPYLDAAEADFTQSDSRRLNERRRIAQETHAQALVDAERSADAIPEIEGLLEIHPYSERLWSSLMMALYRQGRHTEALRAFQRAKETLGENVGIEPAPELRQLEEKMLLHDESLAQADDSPSNLPAAVSSFFGRESEIADLRESLATTRLVTIVGVGGAGKTRLTIEMARGEALSFPDGRWIVDLVPVREGNDVFVAVGRALGLPIEDGEMAARREVLAFLASRRALLVLDNCEHILDDAASAALAILEHCPHVSLLTTSRSALQVPGEAVFPLPILDIPPVTATWSDLKQVSSSALFLERATDAGATVPETEENATTIISICNRLNGLPLAIELAAARVRTIGLSELSSGLATRLSAFGSQRSSSERHRTMTAMMEWSYDLLSVEQQQAFRNLGVFVGCFDAKAAAHVGGVDESAIDIVEETLAALIDRSMVDRVSSETGRSRLLEPFRLFALDVLGRLGELSDLQDRHAAWFCELAHTARLNARSAQRPAMRELITIDSANMQRALKHLHDTGEYGSFGRLVGDLGWLWSDDFLIVENYKWVKIALLHISDIDPGSAARARRLAATAATLGKNPNSACVHITEALRISYEADELLTYADTLIRLSMDPDTFWSTRESPVLPHVSDPIDAAREALLIYEGAGDRWGQIHAGIALARWMIWSDMYDTDEIFAVTTRTRRAALELGDQDGVTRSLLQELATLTAHDNTRVDGTVDLASRFEDLIAAADECRNPETKAWALTSVGWAQFAEGMTDEGLRNLENGLAVADDTGALWVIITGYGQLAKARHVTGDLNGAAAAALKAVNAAMLRSNKLLTVWTLEVTASVLVDRDDPMTATRLLGAAKEGRIRQKNPMPYWDVDEYNESLENIKAAAGTRYGEWLDEGSKWSIAAAADVARDALADSLARSEVPVPH